MKRVWKIIIVISCLILIGIMYFRAYNNFPTSEKNEKDDSNIDYRVLGVLNQRYQSLASCLYLNGARFPLPDLYNFLDNKHVQTTYHGYYLIALLSNAGCNVCQIRELKNIDTLYQKTHLNVLIIYDGFNKNEALYLRKAAYTKLPIYHTAGNQFSSFNIAKKYPLILLVYNGVIVNREKGGEVMKKKIGIRTVFRIYLYENQWSCTDYYNPKYGYCEFADGNFCYPGITVNG